MYTYYIFSFSLYLYDSAKKITATVYFLLVFTATYAYDVQELLLGLAMFSTLYISCVDVLGIAIDFSSLTFHCIFLVWCAFCHALLQ